MLGQPAPARDSPGERSARGIVANMLAPFSYGFIGPARLQFSQGQPTDATNNPLLAVGSHAWPKGRENVATVAGDVRIQLTVCSGRICRPFCIAVVRCSYAYGLVSPPTRRYPCSSIGCSRSTEGHVLALNVGRYDTPTAVESSARRVSYGSSIPGPLVPYNPLARVLFLPGAFEYCRRDISSQCCFLSPYLRGHSDHHQGRRCGPLRAARRCARRPRGLFDPDDRGRSNKKQPADRRRPLAWSPRADRGHRPHN